MRTRGFAVALLGAAVWTLVIKFALPLAAAAREGVRPTTYVMWDFWWAAHLALAWQLLRPGTGARWFALVVTWAEIAIIGTKFAVFLAGPNWNFWTTNWFVNKCYVLALFVLLARHLHATDAGRRFGLSRA